MKEYIVPVYDDGRDDDSIFVGEIREKATEVVRCRDCKYKRMVLKSGCLGCYIHCCLHPYDWYCPDGEKVTES